MKVLIAGGGTGGHLYPGITIAREVLREDGNEVLFVGTARGIEARVLPSEGLPVRFITAGKLKGMRMLSIVRTMLSLPAGIIQSVRVLREFRPNVVIGVGGYASGPVALAAVMLRIPLVIVEPNSYPGLANRMLGRLAKKVMLSFPGNNRHGLFSRDKTTEIGPLVRRGIDQGDREKSRSDFGLDPEAFTILVFGGSGGAHAINMAMNNTAGKLKEMKNIQILHQAGSRDVEQVSAGYRDAGVRAVVLPYIEDMAGAYAAADLVISRAGATTVAELAVCGKSSVLIPYPFAADNHQEYNARALAAQGTTEVIMQKELTPERLATVIRKYGDAVISTKPRRETKAAERIVQTIKAYVQKD